MKHKRIVHYLPQTGDGRQNLLPACGRGNLNTTWHSGHAADVTCDRCLRTRLYAVGQRHGDTAAGLAAMEGEK